MLARLAGHRHALRIALAALAIALLAYGLRSHGTPTRRAAPALPSARLSGPAATLATLRGHASVVVFWASWCADCHQEAAAVERFARSGAGRGHVVAVDYSDGGDWRAFLRQYHWTLPVLADPNGVVGLAYGIRGLPAAVFLDASGRIASTALAAQTEATLRAGLAAAA